MTKKIRRRPSFEVVVEVKDDGFLRTPRDAQREWLLNRAIREFTDDLEYLDSVAPSFISGSSATVDTAEDWTHKDLDEQEIMEDWQVPIMERMAKIAGASGGDVLEIGFGRGVASDFLQAQNVSSHTVVDCNEHVIAEAKRWREKHADREIRILEGLWQDVTGDFDTYDGILFHAYPLNVMEHIEYVVNSVSFAAHFFPTAAKHLRPGGNFTYLTNEYDSMSRAHQRALLDHFSSFTLSKLGGLEVPEDTRDAHWVDSVVIVDVRA